MPPAGMISEAERQVEVLFDGLLSENFSEALSEAFKKGEKDNHAVK
jgi:hypothetical protein